MSREKAIEFIQKKIDIGKVNADNENYLIQFSIADGRHIIELLKSEQANYKAMKEGIGIRISDLQAELKAKDELLEQVLHRAYEEGWTEKLRLKETYHKIEQALKGDER